MSGLVIVAKYMRQPIICWYVFLSCSSRILVCELISESLLSVERGIFTGVAFVSPKRSKHSSMYIGWCIIMPFSMLLTWMPSIVDTSSRSFILKRFLSSLLFSSIILLFSAIMIRSSTYTPIAICGFVKIQVSASHCTKFNSYRKLTSVWNHSRPDCGNPYMAFLIFQTFPADLMSFGGLTWAVRTK